MKRNFTLILLSAILPLLALGCGSPPLEDAENRYFVYSARGSDNNNGKRATSVALIQEAVSRASDTGCEVIVAGFPDPATTRLG